MLALLRPASGKLYHLDFGDPSDVERSAKEQVAWVLEDYPARRDALWDAPPLSGNAELRALLPQLKAFPSVLVSALLALRFYALASASAYEVAALSEHVDPAIRLAAIGALGSMAVYPTTPRLEACLARADRGERLEAANALAKFGTDDAVRILEARAATDAELAPFAERARRRRAVMNTGELNKLVVPVLAEQDYEDLCIFSPFCAPQVAAVLSMPEIKEVVRRRAARVLGLTRQQDVGPAALAAFREPGASAAFRDTLAWAMGRVRYVQALPALYAELARAEGAFELTLIEAIGNIRRRSSLGVLLNQLEQHPTPEVVAASRAALWRISRNVDVDDLRWYQTTEPSVERTWVYVMDEDGRVETQDPSDLLEALLVSRLAARRRDATFALGQLPFSPRRRELLRELSQTDADDTVRAVAARYFERDRSLPLPPA